jgi:hypothetical protein
MNVSVTNKGEDFTGKFDGKEYVFERGKTVVIPEKAAMFLFAFGMDDAARARVLVRNGWQKMGGPEHLRAAKARLGEFSFREGPEDAPRAKPKAIVLEPIRMKDTPRKREAAPPVQDADEVVDDDAPQEPVKAVAPLITPLPGISGFVPPAA